MTQEEEHFECEELYKQQEQIIHEQMNLLLTERIVEDGGYASKFCKESNLNHPQLNRILEKENYTIDTMLKALHALGYDLVALPISDED